MSYAATLETRRLPMPNVKWLPVSKLFVDEGLRSPGWSEPVIEAIASHYDGALAGVFTVVDQGDGTYKIVDGMNRYEAAKRVGVRRVPCDVLSPLEAV